MVATPQAAPSGRQMRQDVSRRRSPRSQPTSSTTRKTSAADAQLKSDGKEALPCSVVTASQATGQESKRRKRLPAHKHDKGALTTDDKLSSQSANTKQAVTHCYVDPLNKHPFLPAMAAPDTSATSVAPVMEPMPPKFYAYGWDEIIQSSHAMLNTRMNQGRSAAKPSMITTGAAQPDHRGRQKIPCVSELFKSCVTLRYQPEHGITPYGTDADADIAQTSDDSQDTNGSSPQGSSCSFTSEDSLIQTNRPKACPPPPSRYFCCHWLEKAYLQYDTPNEKTSRQPPTQRSPPFKAEIHLPPRFTEVCQQWILGRCSLGYSCEYRHLDLKYDDPVSAPTTPQAKLAPAEESISDPPVGQRPAPKSKDICIQWLHGRCKARYSCKYFHEDLDYDPPVPKSIAVRHSSNVADETMEGRTWTVRVHDHAKVKLGPGFDIQELQTGFETPWIYLGNIPAHVRDKEIADLLQPFGKVVDIKLPSYVNNPTILARARFEMPESARDASTVLHNAQAFGVKITARLPMHNASLSNAMFNDASVRIRWEAPSRTAYCGYSTMKLAEAGMQVAREKPFRDCYIHASVHVGLPVVGVVTVRFRGLPVDVKKEDMAWFAKPDDVVWARPNYQDLDLARTGIMRILQQNSELLDFTVLPPPYKNTRVQAWAHFATPSDAKAACNRLHGRKPMFTGKTKIVAEHVQTLSVSVSAPTYEKMSSDIWALRRSVYNGNRITMSIVERPVKTLIKLSGDDLRELGQLKAELSKILNWETIRQGKAIAWDPFFAHPAGQSFLGAIGRCTPNVTIQADIPRRMIRLLGPSTYRSAVRQRILDKITELQTQQIRTVPLDGWLLGHFMQTNLAQLQKQFGYENISLDFYRRQLIVRGGDNVYQAARDVVQRVRQKQLHPARRRSVAICPVCFDEVTNPITLPCAHSWCRECLTHYLSSSIDNKYFPLTCLGNNAKCREHIPLPTARKLLTIPEFDAVVDAAFSAYIQARGDEFHYCPTPDCPQIYRRAPRDTVLQCPSCLLRICPSCHVEAHDGFACPDPEGDKNLFREWMAHHDVKACPGCNVLIERNEGCNHMTCTQCKTHICWVCLKTFPGGNGIYDHMRSVHGGIGLGD
ncbi:hypothetical protein C0993_006056 [Termitomyces sp. T159_Od127]|nr:hypothetical protein C0993_006056 [Termitomyces sp. T159_Od127]